MRPLPALLVATLLTVLVYGAEPEAPVCDLSKYKAWLKVGGEDRGNAPRMGFFHRCERPKAANSPSP